MATDGLQKQIDSKRKEIHSDQYSISIGELANLYRDGELDIHPEFQRFFRWTPEQKSRFVESILLGIPIPSLFVSQREDGKWDVIDGLQRLSTLFQLMGILKDHEEKAVEPLILTTTKYLPALEGMCWSEEQGEKPFSNTQQLLLKRAKLDIKIILRESDESAKFELFQRLNTGGADLSQQEIRNAMLVAANSEFYEWLRELSEYPSFRECVLLSERQTDERYDMELVLRFILLRGMDESNLQMISDIGEFLTEEMMDATTRFEKLKSREDKLFRGTFDVIADTAGADAFRRYDKKRSRFTSGTLISGFEAVALGIGYHMKPRKVPKWDDLDERIRSLWTDSTFVSSSGSGVRASIRIPAIVALGRKLFKP